MSQSTTLIDALKWRPSPPTPATLEFARLAWDFQLPTPEHEYAVELPNSDFEPMYVDYVSAAYAATLHVVGDLKFPNNFGKGPSIVRRIVGLFPGTERGTEVKELWVLAVAWEFDTWLERLLRMNSGDVPDTRSMVEANCPVPPYVANSSDLKAQMLNHPEDSNAPDSNLVLRWMGVRGWNDDRIRLIVEENSIMLNDWHNSPFV